MVTTRRAAAAREAAAEPGSGAEYTEGHANSVVASPGRSPSRRRSTGSTAAEAITPAAPKSPKSPRHANGTSSSPNIPAARSTTKPSANGTAQSGHATGQPHSYEFFGPHGPALLILALPVVVYGLVYACNSSGCLQLWPGLRVPGFPPGTPLFTWEALGVYVAWFTAMVVLHLVLPGKRAKGVLLPNGSRLTYKLNAFTLWALTYFSIGYAAFFTPYLNLGWVYDNFLPLLTAAVLFSTALAVYLYATSFKHGALLSSHGATGWPWYDFWMGRELNPRVGPLDLKEFCELTPGMIGWAIINLGLAHKQYTQLGHVTSGVVLVNLFQLYYILDALWNEAAILTTMDITTDGFGFMLTFGDLAWVPFVFTTSTRFLVDAPQDLGWLGVVGVVGVKLLGYWIFRGANGQKDQFRRDPNHPSVRHLRTLPTARGTKLIVSGWWGRSRHINYFGDWIMGVAWCLPCGLAGLTAVVPYFYCIYFATLLIHRERRDDAACRLKYGKDWDAYCSLVRYRIIPYVY